MSKFASRLNFEQRRRASELEDTIYGDSAYEIAAEVIWRRDQMAKPPLPGECPDCGFDKRGCGCSPTTTR